MPTVDLAQTSLRDLNSALHRLAADTNETHWRVLNPRGQHSVAAGMDARSRSRWKATSGITAPA